MINPILPVSSRQADAFRAALRIPNLIQNLLGEGVLSASFIPVYSRLLEEGRRKDADRLAGAVAGLLTLASGALALVTIVMARPVTRVLAIGMHGDRFDLAVRCVRILTIGTAFLVLAAWCLGVLNSHRSFFLPYVSPVVWNGAQILFVAAAAITHADLETTAIVLAWGVTVGGILQFAVQLPSVLRLAPELRVSFSTKGPTTREVLRRFGPAVLGRGVTQISAFVDISLASLAATGAVAALATGQVLFLLPISLFVMSVAAAQLPELARLTTSAPERVAGEAGAAMRRILFFVGFSAVAYVTVGDLIVALLYQRGKFGSDQTLLVWFVIAAYAVGLPANGASRMLQNTLFALGDTKSPARIAVVRIIFDAMLTMLFMFNLDRVVVTGGHFSGWGDLPGVLGPLSRDVRELEGVVRLGAAGSALGSALAAWIELVLLRRVALAKLGPEVDPLPPMGSLGVASALAFLTGAAVKVPLRELPIFIAAPVTLAVAGLVYCVAAFRTGIGESNLVLGPIRRILWRGRSAQGSNTRSSR